MKKSNLSKLVFLLTSSLYLLPVFASTYYLPAASEALIGSVQYDSTRYNDNVVEVAKRYNLGVNQVANANPHIDPGRGFQAGESLKLPTAFILPPLPRQGIVINLSEMRLYYFPADSGIVKTYPVGIGKVGKTIPLTRTFVSRKVINPIWTPTSNIRAYNRQQGIILPAYIPPGPDNPLGPYAIYLGIPEYRIHSTIFPESIGRRASFGCIRMNESDIKDFFPLISAKTPVNIVDIPTKVGWQGNKLFLEAHPPLEERPSFYSTYTGMVALIEEATRHRPAIINWELVAYLAKEQDGTPHEIGLGL
jgi:L,D-transpeptidase ErfK/SrfK